MTDPTPPAGPGRTAPDGLLVDVVVVAFNSRPLLETLLPQLSQQPRLNLIVVDNASTDGSAEYVRANIPQATVAQLDGNLGFAKAVNHGVGLGTAEFVLLLNPDAQRSAAALDSCLAAFAQPATGAVAPIVSSPDGHSRAAEAGRFPTLRAVAMHWSGLSRLAGLNGIFEGLHLQHSDISGSRVIDWVSGSCVLISRHAWDEVGGMTERYFMYAEDVDLCIRLARGGYAVRLEAAAHALHAVGQSSGVSIARSPRRHDWFLNLFDCYQRHWRPGRTRARAWQVVFAAGLLSRAIVYLAQGCARPADRRRRLADARRFAQSARVMLAAPLATRDPR